MEKIGIFGGTFDPIHNGHIKALKVFIDAFDLDKTMVIPTAVPPHKVFSGETDENSRLMMTRLAVEDVEGAEVNDFEIKNGGKSYTVETLKYFHKLYPASKFFLFTGSDMFLTLQNWHNAAEIMTLSEIAAFSRSGDDYEKLEAHKKYLEANFGAVCHLIEVEPLHISSTILRDMIKKGEDISRYVPEKVYDYIKQNNLYKNLKDKITRDVNDCKC